MIYPDFLKKGDTVGIAAPSDGRSDAIDLIRLDSAEGQFEKRGFRVRETAHVRCSERGRSADGRTRAGELLELFEDDNCKMILSASGGDWLFEMLPYVDYEKIARNPKWFEGMSDPTGLTYTITTVCDIATVYCANAGEFGMEPWDETLEANIDILSGNFSKKQKSCEMYQEGWLKLSTGCECYEKTAPVSWKILSGGAGDCVESGRSEAVNAVKAGEAACGLKNAENFKEPVKEVSVKGRLIGGCLDVLGCLVGTRFDKTEDFLEKYRADGFLWYLEVFSMTPEQIAFNLWQLKEAGWFKYVKGILLGRPASVISDFTDISYEEAVMSVLGELGCPVISEMDFGHRPPHLTIVNGAVGTVFCKDGKGYLVLENK